MYPNRTQLNELALHLTALAAECPTGNKIEVLHDQVVVNGAYLHRDGEWATYPEGQRVEAHERVEVND